MAEASSSTNCKTEDFCCPVCQEILQTPVRTLYCGHVFCRKCFLTAMKSGGAFCPLCRGAVCRRERSAPTRASDIEMEMRRLSGGCLYCGKQVKLCYMKSHYKSCKKYQEEYGIAPVHTTLQPYSDSSKRLDPTYKCPLCSQQNLNRKSLLDHCNIVHYFQNVETVCPICATLPWGETNQTTGNVVAHLNARHQFSYEEFMNVYLDEEAQYQAAIVNSYEVYS